MDLCHAGRAYQYLLLLLTAGYGARIICTRYNYCCSYILRTSLTVYPVLYQGIKYRPVGILYERSLLNDELYRLLLKRHAYILSRTAGRTHDTTLQLYRNSLYTYVRQ